MLTLLSVGYKLALFLILKSKQSIMSKQSLSERDICSKYVTPALERVGCDVLIRIGIMMNRKNYDWNMLSGR